MLNIPRQSSDIFTCINCNIAFNNSESQRDHYKTDWHRYNLKRKVADLPAVSLADFNQRVQLQKSEIENAESNQNEPLFCKLCAKHFTTVNSYQNHKQSKKHKDIEQAYMNEKNLNSSQDEDLKAVKSDKAQKRKEQMEEMLKVAQQQQQKQEVQEVQEEEEGMLDDQDWEDVGEEEFSEYDESTGIELNTCFFCSFKGSSVEQKLEHMAKEHSFFIPDVEHVSDMEGLLKFLGVKVGTYHVCLWCSSKCYRDTLSCQKHMIDKGHQKMKFEGETIIEYADFYEYEDEVGDETRRTEDSYDMADESIISTIATLQSNDTSQVPSAFDDNYELVLPSGTRIGHRSLFRYYKQSFGHRNLEAKERSKLTVKDKYKAIAMGTAYSYTEVKKQRKDMAYFQRWSAKMHASLGVETNKLQKHFRRQDIIF